MKADTFAFFAHFSEYILLCLDNNGDKGCKKFSVRPGFDYKKAD